MLSTRSKHRLWLNFINTGNGHKQLINGQETGHPGGNIKQLLILKILQTLQLID